MRNPDDFRQEIQAHVELEADRLREQGLSPEEFGLFRGTCFSLSRRAELAQYEVNS
jgi:hypothetical protein